MQNLQVVCAYKFADPTHPDTSPIEIEDFPRHRGIWNKNIVTWWIKGDARDNAFVEREAFLKRCFNIGFTEWDLEIPVSFIQATSEEDADIIIEFGPMATDDYYGPGSNVLAYAGFPDGSLKGYIKFLTDWDWNAHGATGVNIIIVTEHELGHTIGLSHSNKIVPEDLMAAVYNKNTLEATAYDVARSVNAYGARVYDHPSHHDRLETAHKLSKIRIQNQEIAKS